ncbi:hypothetical protein PHACT_02695 [Pseudohongiella acticola]|uniref:Uncharacterized protein n=1 Tax=Pseudohongiella acticola TaxID=1524254 RepID=A0A1E8CIE3_9GAMM|nr:hypothetical protein PHACT_02695 [Pseudohongiella acticola]
MLSADSSARVWLPVVKWSVVIALSGEGGCASTGRIAAIAVTQRSTTQADPQGPFMKKAPRHVKASQHADVSQYANAPRKIDGHADPALRLVYSLSIV